MDDYPKNIISVIEAYADGSCKGNPGPGGWGWVIFEKGTLCNMQFSDYGGKNVTTNNNMELTAMAEFLEFLSIGKSVNIYSDSCYVLGGIVGKVKGLTQLQNPPQGWLQGKIRSSNKKLTLSYHETYWKSSLLNGEVWWRINKSLVKHIEGGSNLYFAWVKGHAKGKHPGNDLADELSNKWYLDIKKGNKLDNLTLAIDKNKIEPVIKTDKMKLLSYYAVKKGVKPGVYETWAECEENVKGFTGCEHKKFKTKEEAEKFVG